MLTIKSPIKLRCRYQMETMHKDLAEKIMGNYTLLNDYVRKEELLYVTTQAPEVYFAEGNNISILNDIKTENRHELRLDVINNLINRILLSGTENFSYQDTVYISNVLRKFGITDVSNFMKQVYRLQEEKKENHQLIDVYEEQKQLLTQLFEAQQQGQTKGDKEPEREQAVSSNQYYIHEEIYNRLHTGKIYEEFKHFTQGLESNTKRIYNTEVAVSEQLSLIQNFNLHNLKNEILHQEEPIYYYHANQYELIENDELSGEQSEGRVSAAVLLNLVDQIYALRMNQIEQNSHRWYTVANALFQTAENTWKRYEVNHKEGKTVFADMYQNMVEVVNNKQSERNIINNIIEEVKAINMQEIEEAEIYQDFSVNKQESQQIDLQTLHKIQQQQDHMHVTQNQENYRNQEHTTTVQEQTNVDILNLNQQELRTESVNIQNHITQLMEAGVTRTEQIQNNAIIQTKVNDTVNLTYVDMNETLMEEENQTVQELSQSQIHNLHQEQIRRQEEVDRSVLNQQNLEQFIQSLNQPTEQTFVNMEQNQQMLMSELTHIEQSMAEVEPQITEHVSELTLKQFDEISKKNIENYKKILEIEKQRPKQKNVVLNKEKARKDALRALENPQEVLQELIQTEVTDVHEEINQQLDEQIYNLFSDETKNIFEQVMLQKNGNMPQGYAEAELQHFIEGEPENEDTETQPVSVTKELIREVQKSFDSDKQFEQIQTQIQNVDASINQNVTIEEQNQNLILQKTESILNQIMTQAPATARVAMQPTELTYAHEMLENEEVEGPLGERITREIVQEVGKQQTNVALTMIQKPAVTYALNEAIKNEIHALKQLEVSNIYENYLQAGEIGTRGIGQQASAQETHQTQAPEQLELQHIMSQAELEERIVIPTMTRIEERRQAVGLVHKVEEQILTEELINEIKSQTVDNVREETREVNEIHNVNHTQKQINETVNRIQVNQQENIEELVKQNVKKQLNQLTDQVYGKIEKKLQTERKRRGY